MAKKPLNIGLVGYGFMGRAHSNAFRQAPRFFDLPYQPVLKAMCARNADRAKTFAANWGYESVETDWRALVERDDIDLVDIASPNDTHAEIAIAAARAGKMVLCEKPLGRNGAEAKRMVDAVESAGVPNMVWYNYRRVPAVTLIKSLVDEGVTRPGVPLPREVPSGLDDVDGAAAGRRRSLAPGRGSRGQRRDRRSARALHRHGDVAQRADCRRHRRDGDVHQRTHAQPQRTRRAGGIDDASAFLCRFENGSLATFEATRYARGHKALYTLEINGEHASAAWDLHDLHRVQFFDHGDEGRCAGGATCTSPTAIIRT